MTRIKSIIFNFINCVFNSFICKFSTIKIKISISKETNEVKNESEAIKEVKVEEKKPSNIFEATKIRQQDQEQKEINKAKLNPGFKVFIPARKVLEKENQWLSASKEKLLKNLKNS